MNFQLANNDTYYIQPSIVRKQTPKELFAPMIKAIRLGHSLMTSSAMYNQSGHITVHVPDDSYLLELPPISEFSRQILPCTLYHIFSRLTTFLVPHHDDKITRKFTEKCIRIQVEFSSKFHPEILYSSFRCRWFPECLYLFTELSAKSRPF